MHTYLFIELLIYIIKIEIEFHPFKCLQLYHKASFYNLIACY